ncbi:hypothetical protein A2264_01915 [candidate division WWE3 bacterium RIFOXYA2_FULL_46_9]|uniref:Uncharacterized protein n=1 Tax=candidate division WWE3 bacterium RIFOXYA2_FULL_46_9 TaxID=1802636 RepID=A0A1F4W0Y8_UNCKA|nr:MAG: hypothetical protein A2264_01915 [candidate division WWE3 bacterium RIFOXYA2_FULL_46_9]
MDERKRKALRDALQMSRWFAGACLAYAALDAVCIVLILVDEEWPFLPLKMRMVLAGVMVVFLIVGYLFRDFVD